MGAAEEGHRCCGQQESEANHHDVAATLQGERRNQNCEKEYEGPEDRARSSKHDRLH